MRRGPWLAICCGGVLGGTVLAQEPAVSRAPVVPEPLSAAPLRPGPDTQAGIPPESLPGLEAATAGQPVSNLGPTPVQDVKLLQDLLERLCHDTDEFDPCMGKAKESAVKIYGWVDMGYTYSTSGSGPLSVEPRSNHFGDEFTWNQVAVTIEKPLDPKELSWGFLIQPYGGSDAALLNPIRGAVVENPDLRFGFDFRNLYVQAHLPILTEGGDDVEAGQHYPLIGYQSAMAPFRTFYSYDYQLFYGESGSFTGVVTTVHVNKQLDVVNAVSLGYITFFTNLSVAPTHMGRIDYWLHEDKRTLISVGVVTGPVSPHSGDVTTLVDVTLTQNWNKRLTQIVQFGAGYSENGVFVPGLERDYGLYNLFLYHLNPTVDLNFRAEWYDDVDGRGYPGGTGFKNNYEEFTLGIDYHPKKWLQLRPELRRLRERRAGVRAGRRRPQ